MAGLTALIPFWANIECRSESAVHGSVVVAHLWVEFSSLHWFISRWVPCPYLILVHCPFHLLVGRPSDKLASMHAHSTLTSVWIHHFAGSTQSTSGKHPIICDAHMLAHISQSHNGCSELKCCPHELPFFVGCWWLSMPNLSGMSETLPSRIHPRLQSFLDTGDSEHSSWATWGKRATSWYSCFSPPPYLWQLFTKYQELTYQSATSMACFEWCLWSPWVFFSKVIWMETQPEGPWTQKLEGVLHMYLNKIWDWDFFEMWQQNADCSFMNACTGPVFYHQRVLSTNARRTRVDEIEDQSTGAFVAPCWWHHPPSLALLFFRCSHTGTDVGGFVPHYSSYQCLPISIVTCFPVTGYCFFW